MAAHTDCTKKLSKAERRARKKHLRTHHTLFRHENIRISDTPTEHLVVGNGGLGNDVGREELWDLFSKHGHVLDIIMQPRKPFSFVSFSRTSDARTAVENLHGRKLSSPEELANPDVVFYLSFVESVPGYEVPKTVLPPGLFLLEDYISEEYEQELLSSIDWKRTDVNTKQESSLKHRRVKHYGYEFIYGINNIDVTKPLPQGIPCQCQSLLAQLLEQGHITEYPDQLTVNEYQPGQGIPPHIDTHSACSDHLVSLSLGSQVVMDFRHPDGRHVPVLLPPRSVLVMTGESRYVWTHGITPRKSDIVPVRTTKSQQCPCDSAEQSGAGEAQCQEQSHDKIPDSDHMTRTSDEQVAEAVCGNVAADGQKEARNDLVDDSSRNVTVCEDVRTRLTMVKRQVRTSLTFRKTLTGSCQCKYGKQCDSQQKENLISENQSDEPEASIPTTDQEAAMLEELHVHKVYENIAEHFSDTRHKAWPKVAEFLNRQTEGAIIADIGCGNGKYLGVNTKTFSMGCDRSSNLCQICSARGFSVFVGDVLSVPLRNNSCDVAISIAVLHHLSTLDRRSRAVQEMLRVLVTGGQALISVWAFEQELDNQKSNYLSKSKLRQKLNKSPCHNVPGDDRVCPESQADVTNDTEEDGNRAWDVAQSCSGKLTVHVNRTHFENQDLLVPWHKKAKGNTHQARESDREDSEPKAVGRDQPAQHSVHHRFYHVFHQGELEELVSSLPNARIIDSYHDKGNWCIIFEKTGT